MLGSPFLMMQPLLVFLLRLPYQCHNENPRCYSLFCVAQKLNLSKKVFYQSANATANLNYARLDLKRQQALREKSLVSENDIDVAQTAFDVAEAQFQQWLDVASEDDSVDFVIEQIGSQRQAASACREAFFEWLSDARLADLEAQMQALIRTAGQS